MAGWKPPCVDRTGRRSTLCADSPNCISPHAERDTVRRGDHDALRPVRAVRHIRGAGQLLLHAHHNEKTRTHVASLSQLLLHLHVDYRA
jgi:hypothetical protein